MKRYLDFILLFYYFSIIIKIKGKVQIYIDLFLINVVKFYVFSFEMFILFEKTNEHIMCILLSYKDIFKFYV